MVIVSDIAQDCVIIIQHYTCSEIRMVARVFLLSIREWNGRKTEVFHLRFLNFEGMYTATCTLFKSVVSRSRFAAMSGALITVVPRARVTA